VEVAGATLKIPVVLEIFPGLQVKVGVPDPQPPLPEIVAVIVTFWFGQITAGFGFGVALRMKTGGTPGVVKVYVADHGPALPDPQTRSRARNTYCVPGHKAVNGTVTGRYGSKTQLSANGFGIFSALLQNG
jgi:hypothetical protein